MEEVKASKKAYYKAHSEALQITDKFGQVREGGGRGGKKERRGGREEGKREGGREEGRPPLWLLQGFS